MVTTALQANEIDPRVKRTRRLLMQAFEELLQEKSISSISVQDIAERATVNRATFYAHFEDKYAFLDSWMREEFQQVLASKLPAPSAMRVDSLRVLILAVFDFLARFHSRCKQSDRQLEPMFETAMQQELYELLLAWLKQLPSSGLRRETLEITSQVMSWTIFGPAVQWSRGERAYSAEEMAHQVMALALDGLSGIIGPIS
jgi:AcrR family transcriptional regulator